MDRARLTSAHDVVRLEGSFDRRDVPGQAARIAAEADRWRLPVRAVGLWCATAADRIPRGLAARWTLEYDPRLRLISFEVHTGNGRVYGVDDVLA